MYALREHVCVFASCWAYFWSRCAFISSVARRPALARLALENNNTVNETQLKHFSYKNNHIKHNKKKLATGFDIEPTQPTTWGRSRLMTHFWPIFKVSNAVLLDNHV